MKEKNWLEILKYRNSTRKPQEKPIENRCFRNSEKNDQQLFIRQRLRRFTAETCCWKRWCMWQVCCSCYIIITGGRSSTSVNGDIAIQWEWSNFDHS